MNIIKNIIYIIALISLCSTAVAIVEPISPFSGFEINDEVSVDLPEPSEPISIYDDKRFIMYPKEIKEILVPMVVHVVDNSLMHEHDIIIGKVNDFDLFNFESLHEPKPEFKVKYAGVATGTLSSREYRWFDSVIPYEIDPSFHESKVKSIREAADLWTQKTNLLFVDISHSKDSYSNGHIFRKARIKFLPHQNQCSSYVGMRVPKKDDFGKWQAINLAEGCYGKQILHEIGHAIGLFHEQTRSDRDDYIEVHKEAIIDDKYSQYQQKTKYNASNLSEYDFNSIMHYSNRGFAKSEANTFTVKAQHQSKVQGEIGSQYRLSDLDIVSVNKIYPQKPLKGESYYIPTQTTKSTVTIPQAKQSVSLEAIGQLLKSKLPLKGYDQLGKFSCKANNIGSTQLQKCVGTLNSSSKSSSTQFEAKVSMSGSTPSYIIYMR